jgi:hypothetical protein
LTIAAKPGLGYAARIVSRHRLLGSVPGLALVLVLAGLPGLPGCSAKPPPPQTADHLRKILQAFDLANYEKRRGPKDEDELKVYLKQLEGVQDPDQWLRSPNDGQPYEIIWGVNLMDETDIKAIVAYEKQGVAGKRQVITVARIVREMSDAEFSEATFATGKKPRKKRE